MHDRPDRGQKRVIALCMAVAFIDSQTPPKKQNAQEGTNHAEATMAEGPDSSSVAEP